MKRLLSLLLVFIMLISIFAVAPFSASASTSLPNSIYITQATTGSYGTCTLASVTMMLRSRAYLSGHSNWSSITESAVKSVAWGSSLKWSFTYTATGISISVARNPVSGISISSLKSLLNSHPEGIMLYCGNIPHAVFVTDYEGDTFYCADPDPGYSGSRRTLASSALGKKYGSQSSVLSNATAYWYVSSYNITGHTTHSYDTYVYYLDSHPHYKCYKCICGEVKSNGSEPTYVSSCEECVAHTCDKAIEYSYWAAHPHYPIYQCSLCGKNNTDYTQTKYISSCEECIAHTCNKDIEYSYWSAHPHYPIYQCSLCGKNNTDYTQTKYISSCEECVIQIDMILGDVDGDKKVSIIDATEIQRHIAQLSTIPEDRLSCADTDRDTRISIMDATQIQRFIAQLIPSL